MMVEGMKMLDGVVRDVPAALEKYVRYSCHVSRVGSFMLHNCIHINEATSLARLSCEAAVKWYHAKSSDTKVITEVGSQFISYITRTNIMSFCPQVLYP